MYCKKCGLLNPEGSRFCQHCGINFEESVDYTHELHSSHKYVDKNISPYPYVISTSKLIILTLATFGFYEIYWFYRHWKSFNEYKKLRHGTLSLELLSLFAPLTSYSLFKHISSETKQLNGNKGLESGALAILYFMLSRIFLGFVPLISVQNVINYFWQEKYADKLVRSKFGAWNWIIVTTSVLSLLLLIILADTEQSSYSYSNAITTPTPTVSLSTNSYNQEAVVSSVVNILCTSTYAREGTSSGSGTILTDDGIVLTNSHVIPQDKASLHVGEQGCLVVLPNANTGQPDEMYWAHPIVLSGLSEKYDLAYLSIYAPYYDDQLQRYYGTYPKEFPAFDNSTRCVNKSLQLGEPIRVFGYPAISGGYTLTITDGLVSSFPGDGLIVTSAKISHGNSGGLAVDKNGCMVGVPSMVSSDDSESLGVIYSMDLVNEFTSEVTQYLNE